MVTYGGTLASNVRLYGSNTGDIAPYLTLTVTRGTDNSPMFPTCGASFNPDATNYIGQGNGVIYQGTPGIYGALFDTSVFSARDTMARLRLAREKYTPRAAYNDNVDAKQALEGAFTPMSDQRGSAAYRSAMITRLVDKLWAEAGGER